MRLTTPFTALRNATQIFGECMILIINYLKTIDKIIGKKNA